MAKPLPILTFHSLEERRAATSFPPHLFQRSMARLHQAGYRTASLGEVAECLRTGRPFPDRVVAITFDDGYQTVYTQALPVLQRYGLSATVFLTTGPGPAAPPTGRLPSLGGRAMLAWEEIRHMHRLGIDVGAHTCTHPDLTRLPPAQAEAEICRSQAIVEEVLGAPVVSFAYPYGLYDERSRDIVRQRFACACSAALGLITARSDPYALARIDTYYLGTDRLWGLVQTGLFPWYIRARSLPRRVRRALFRKPG